MTGRTSKRRNPKLAGVAGITPEDLAALDAKRVTLQDLADHCGITKQAAAKRIKAMRLASTATTSPASIRTDASIPAGAVQVDPVEIATSACLGALVRAHAALIGPEQIGPSGLKALAIVISTATAELRQLGVLALDDVDTPTELVVRIMTDKEHDEIKRRAELPGNYLLE